MRSPLLDRLDLLPIGQQRSLLFLASFLFLVAAAPRNLLRGILYAEEGTTYLRYAREAGALRALLAPHQGYFALVPNLATDLAAHSIPLLYVPLFTAWCALAVHLLVASLAVTCELFTSFRQRAGAVAVATLAAGSANTFNGTINSQFFLGIATALLFLSSPLRHRLFRGLVLVVAGLTGTVSCFLLPFFLLRARNSRSVGAWLQAALLSTCAAIQLAVIHHALPFTARSSIPLLPPKVYLDALFTHSFVLPFASRLAFYPLTTFLSAHPSSPVWIALSLFSLMLWTLLVRLVWSGGALPRLLLLMALFAAACSTAGIIGTPGNRVGDGDRYYVVTNALVGFALLLRLRTPPRLNSDTSARRLSQLALTLFLLSGALDFARFWNANQFAPAWRPQVLAWQSDPTFPLVIAPRIWRNAPLSFSPQPGSLALPFYIFDSNLSSAAIGTIPPECFGPHWSANLPCDLGRAE